MLLHVDVQSTLNVLHPITFLVHSHLSRQDIHYPLHWFHLPLHIPIHGCIHQVPLPLYPCTVLLIHLLHLPASSFLFMMNLMREKVKRKRKRYWDISQVYDHRVVRRFSVVVTDVPHSMVHVLTRMIRGHLLQPRMERNLLSHHNKCECLHHSILREMTILIKKKTSFRPSSARKRWDLFSVRLHLGVFHAKKRIAKKLPMKSSSSSSTSSSMIT